MSLHPVRSIIAILALYYYYYYILSHDDSNINNIITKTSVITSRLMTTTTTTRDVLLLLRNVIKQQLQRKPQRWVVRTLQYYNIIFIYFYVITILCGFNYEHIQGKIKRNPPSCTYLFVCVSILKYVPSYNKIHSLSTIFLFLIIILSSELFILSRTL